jgi:5,6-dimethylbenzimidazole synthase
VSDSPAPVFDDAFRSRLRELIAWRRDVRHFRRDPLPAGALERLIECACLAPSVGLSQPWRFIIVQNAERRAAIRACFEACNADALRAQAPDRAALYARLKLAGLDDAPGHIAVFADRATSQGYGLGRLTMPETIDYSVVMAMHTLWLAARAEGIGVGWVSILDPARVATIMCAQQTWMFIGYLCVGYPAEAHETPVLERKGWETRRAACDVILYR